jgi:hypothetical protein
MVPTALMGELPVLEATPQVVADCLVRLSVLADCLVRPSVLAGPGPVYVVVAPKHRY